MIISHAGAIQLLPAIPAAWSVEGSFKGLKARGGFTVNCKWENGKVVSYMIRSATKTKVKVIVNGETKTIISSKM